MSKQSSSQLVRRISLFGLMMLGSSILLGAPVGVGTLRDSSAFKTAPGNNVPAAVTDSAVVPESGVRAGIDNSVEFSVDFPGDNLRSTQRFQPVKKTPGYARKLAMKIAGEPDSQYKWFVNFRDRNGRSGDGKNTYALELNPQAEWQDVEFVIPDEWPQDLYLADISVDNAGQESVKKTAGIKVYDLKLTVDLAPVKKKELDSLTFIDFFETAGDRLYHAGDEVKYRLNLSNWQDAPVTGKLNIKVTDPLGKIVFDRNYDVNAASTFSTNVALKPSLNGSYRLDYVLDAGNRKLAGHRRFAMIPEPNKITREEQKLSPWGLNVHGAQEDSPMWLFSDLGVTWVRDYAYSYGWVKWSKDAEGKHTGWPWYDRMDKRYKDANLMVLGCFMRSLQNGINERKLETPDDEWFQVFTDFSGEYPDLDAWELDNEYDLSNQAYIGGNAWNAYCNFHREWSAKMKKLPISGLVAAEGKAGIAPDVVREAVKTGAFKDLDVINAHFYCGVSAPELGTQNVNAHGDNKAQHEKAFIYDALRALVAAGSSDGVKRQTWITEFGWDTKAVHVATEEEQAAYLQRAYILGLHAGLEKMFWFFHFDSGEENPSTFFGGCGLYDWHKDPKPSAAGMAFMTKLLVNPEIVGTFNPGDNGAGYVIADRGRLVGMVFKLDKNKTGCEVDLSGDEIYDMFGNPLAPGPRVLDITPIWIDGLSADSPFVKQTPFELDSDAYMVSCAGEKLQLKFKYEPNRHTPDTKSISYKLLLPEAWKQDVSGTVELSDAESAAGKVIPVEFSIPIDVPEGDYPARLIVTDNTNGAVKPIDFVVFARTPATVTMEPFSGTAGKPVKVKLKVRNNSQESRTLILKPVLPANWSVTPTSLALKDMPGMTIADAEFDVTWAPVDGIGDSAKIEVYNDKLQKLCESTVTPPSITIKKLDNLTLDGDLADWPAESRIPNEFIGATKANQDYEFYIGYNEKGIYFAVKVDDSKAVHATPTWFWRQDAVEFFIDTANDKTEGRDYGPNDVHLWVVPMVSTGKVYLGKWGHLKDEESQTDIPNDGASRVVGNGYVMEGMIPVNLLPNTKLEPGTLIGLNFNARVEQKNNDAYEFFWSSSKRHQVQAKPAAWGTLLLK